MNSRERAGEEGYRANPKNTVRIGVVGIKWMENSAHMPMQEEPKAYTEALLNFFAGRLDAG